MGKEDKKIHSNLGSGNIEQKKHSGNIKGNAQEKKKNIGGRKEYTGQVKRDAGQRGQCAGEQGAGQAAYAGKAAGMRKRAGEEYGKQPDQGGTIGEQIIHDFVGDKGRDGKPESRSGDRREIRGQSVSDFRGTTRMVEHAGSAVAQAGRSAVSSVRNEEDAVFMGAGEIGDTVSPALRVLAHSGANASYNRMRNQALTVADAADALDSAFAEGRITRGMVEGNRETVIHNLRQSGMPVPMAKKIARNLEEIQDKLTARAAVLAFGAETGKLSADDIDFVGSRAFFDPVSFDRHYGRIAGAYLRGSGSPLFEKVNPAHFSVEDIDKRLRLDRAAERVRRKVSEGGRREEIGGAGKKASRKANGDGKDGDRETRKAVETGKDSGKTGKKIKLSKAEEKLLRERPLSAGEKAFLQELKRMKEGKRIAAKGKPHHGIHKAGDFAGMGWRYLQRADDAAVAGARQLAELYRGGRGAVLVTRGSYQAGKKAARFAGRGAVRLAHTRPVRFVGYQIKVAGRVVASAAKKTRPVQGMARAGRHGKAVAGNIKKSARNVRQAAGRAVRGSRPVRAVSGSPRMASLRGMAQTAKEKAQKAGRKVRHTGGNVYRKSRRAGRMVKDGVGKAGRAVRRPIDLVLKPFHVLGQAFNALKEFFMKKLLLPLAVGAGVGVVLYTLLIAMFSFMYGLGKTAGEAGQNLLGIRREEDVKEWVELLNGKAEAVYREAVEAAKGAPVSGTVYDGVSLYAYGSPKSAGDETAGYYHQGEAIDPAKLNGWHIIYLDSDGNVIGNNTSNTRDIISLAAVMMNNSMEDSAEVKDLLEDMWEGMKPVLTLCESDIYHTEYSTDTFPFDGGDYDCTDSDFYSHYAFAVAEGVVMYEEAAEAHLQDAGAAGNRYSAGDMGSTGNADSAGNTDSEGAADGAGSADSGGYICSGKGCEYMEWEEWVLVCTREEHSHSAACQTSRHRDPDGAVCEDPAHCTEESHYEGQDCDREEHVHSKEGGCYRQDVHRDYYCPGHAALHCSYGYRDINVFVTLLDKEDFFKAEIDSSRVVMAYKKPVAVSGQGTSADLFGGAAGSVGEADDFPGDVGGFHGDMGESLWNSGSSLEAAGSFSETVGGSLGTAGDISHGSPWIEFEECTAVVEFETYFDSYRKRMKDFVNNGFWDYGEHLLHAVYNPENGCVECALNHLGDAYTLENKEAAPADKCIGAIEWVNRIYDTDWYELYGVSVDSYDSGIAVGGTLSADERAEIQEAIGLRYGDISSARQALVDTALSQVGAVRYYWGGKPVNAGMPLTVSLNGAGTAAVGAACAADQKGRAVAGLDCSGFVGWAYWTAFGVKPGMSTGTFTDSLGMEQIHFGELQPGDIGLQAVPGAASNHIGIFLGLDGNGKALWVHCSGSGGVVVNNTNCFRLYYRLM